MKCMKTALSAALALLCVIGMAGAALAVDSIAYVGNWDALAAAARDGMNYIVITEDIICGPGQDTVVFHYPITIRSARDKYYTLDGGGKQILCVQGYSEDKPLHGLTTVMNLKLQNGDAAASSADNAYGSCGGALYVQGDLKAENVEFIGNRALQGGALFVSGNLMLATCTFSDNSADYGGAVYVQDGSLLFESTVVHENAARVYGGGVLAYNGDITMTGGTISENTAFDGGGIFISDGDLSMAGGEVSNNKADDGAGIFIRQGDVLISGGEISRNTAEYYGGGAYIYEGDVMFTGGGIFKNTSGDWGGGVYIVNGECNTTTNYAPLYENTPDDFSIIQE